MTAGYAPEEHWDEARIALGRVAQAFVDNETVTPDNLRGIEGYERIPEGVRTTLEDLSETEQEVAKRLIQVLASNHFYIEGGIGGLAFY